MIEYGNGVGEVAGKAGGGSGGGGHPMDVGASMSQFVTDSVHVIHDAARDPPPVARGHRRRSAMLKRVF
jgi:hypothetical protein